MELRSPDAVHLSARGDIVRQERYHVITHLLATPVRLEKDYYCLPRGRDYLYVHRHEMLFVRPRLPLDRGTVALATGLAERDVLLRGPQYGISDPMQIAALRLAPFDVLVDLMARYQGGITAVARELTVPPPFVARRIEMLTESERRVLARATSLVEDNESDQRIRPVREAGN